MNKYISSKWISAALHKPLLLSDQKQSDFVLLMDMCNNYAIGSWAKCPCGNDYYWKIDSANKNFRKDSIAFWMDIPEEPME